MNTEEKELDNIAEILKQKAGFWSFSRLLEELWGNQGNLSLRLTEKLTEYEKGKDPEGVSRKVRNWLHDRNQPGNREELFKISFAMGLDEKEAEILLGTTSESGIHYRNPRELIYAFCLRTGENYPKARELADSLAGEIPPLGTLEYKRKIRSMREEEDREARTVSVRNEFKRIRTEEELRRFFDQNKETFGMHHNTAYRKFMKMLEYLKNPQAEGEDLPRERSYGTEEIVKEYLRMKMPYDRRMKNYSRIQKEVKKHWPTVKTINDMISRKMDVDRKTLILLYLSTEGIAAGRENMSWELYVKEHYLRLNMMLRQCGMAGLNLHCPFDYMVMQAMRCQGDEEYMGLRMERMIRRLFREKDKIAYVEQEEGK